MDNEAYKRFFSVPEGERFTDAGEKMRSRSNSGVQLDSYQRIVYKTLLRYQDPVSGLFPGKVGGNETWIRDNVYSVLAVWALAMAYRKHSDADEDRSKAYELEQRVVKSMRALLTCMMRQADKVENFKKTQQAKDSLHAKYALRGMTTVCGDLDYGHLQIDAVSIYVLFLAQLTASGLQIVFSLDEVAFIQNIVWYTESAYRVPDYGIWERGDKSNHGNPELNASSVGMAKAALEAINDLDLFGASGGPSSVIHCIADEAEKCYAVLTSMLPRESNSKEIDAAILSIIGYPAFAVDDQEIVKRTREAIVSKLQGRFGMKRFLRDGYNTPVEDKSRLYYELWELAGFEDIECEWPVFFCYQILDGLFRGDDDMVETYWDLLMEVMVLSNEDGTTKLMPEMYTVPLPVMDKEKDVPHSQQRKAIGRTPFLWGQSLYILCSLIKEGFLQAGEIDPLCRRNVLGTEAQRPDVVVQIVVLAEDEFVQQKLLANGIEVETVDDLQPIEVYPARVLSYIFSQLGRSSKLGLSGRPSTEIGVLSTSTLYQLNDRTIAFIPQTFDITAFYWALDVDLLIDIFRLDISYLAKNWKLLGRPTMVLTISAEYFDADGKLSHTLAATYRKLKTGYISGTRIIVGRLQNFLTTSCTYRLQFLSTLDGGGGGTNAAGSTQQQYNSDIEANIFHFVRDFVNQRLCARPQLPSAKRRSVIASTAGGSGSCGGQQQQQQQSSLKRQLSQAQRKKAGSVRGIIHRATSIQVDNIHPGNVDIRTRFSGVANNQSEENNDRRRYPPVINVRGSSSIEEADERITAICGERGVPHLKDGSDVDAAVRETVNASPEELVQMLKETESLGEQAEIIHYLYALKGAQWDTKINGSEGGLNGTPVTVQVLVKELYDKACHMKKWWLVRHAAGMLERKSEDLAKAVSDLLVRQKQITVGMPSDQEYTITRPLPPEELSRLIKKAYGDDSSTAMLTQELLMYLAMFIRTEAQLFHDLLRLRIGLIIQVMATELARAMSADGAQATEFLLNLSPYEMKVLLHYILSGKELAVREPTDDDAAAAAGSTLSVVGGGGGHGPFSNNASFAGVAGGAGVGGRRPSALNPDDLIHIHNVGTKAARSGIARLRKSLQVSTRASSTHFMQSLAAGREEAAALSTASSAVSGMGMSPNPSNNSTEARETLERTGRWLRRRRLDGSLNRIPQDFYPKVWVVLSKCKGLRIADVLISPMLTREMTPFEIKFALQLENVLNRVPQPEYRQLLVEALMVLVLLVDTEPALSFRGEISIEEIVRCAYRMFLDDQYRGQGDATLCCAREDAQQKISNTAAQVGPNCAPSRCGGAAGVCLHFYDSAPSGRFGTVTYLSRAVSLIVDICVPQIVGSHTSLRDPKLRRESLATYDGFKGAPSVAAGRKVSATNPLFDCSTQKKLYILKQELERLELELSRIEINDEHLSHEAFQLRRSLRDEARMSRNNAVQLSDYHSLYELQRKRLEKQISDLVKERAAWIRAAYRLAIKYVDDRHLEPIHALHLSHRSWFHLTKQVVQVYEASERRDLADLARIVDSCTRHVQRVEERLLANEIEIMKNVRHMQSDLLRLLKRVHINSGGDAPAVAPSASSAEVIHSTEQQIDLNKDAKQCMARWSQMLFALKLLISGEELQRTTKCITEIESLTDTLVSLCINLFRRHYRPFCILNEDGTTVTKNSGGGNKKAKVIDIYDTKNWRHQGIAPESPPSSSSDDEEIDLFNDEKSSSSGSSENEADKTPSAAKPSLPPRKRYSSIERAHQFKRHRRQRNARRRQTAAAAAAAAALAGTSAADVPPTHDDFERVDAEDDDKIFLSLYKDEVPQMLHRFRQFVPPAMREHGGTGVDEYFAPFQYKREFGALYRIDVRVRDLMEEQRSRASGDNGVGDCLQRIDDDIHYIEMMRSGNNKTVSLEQIAALREMLPNWFGLTETCVKTLEKIIPTISSTTTEKSQEANSGVVVDTNKQQAKSSSNTTAAAAHGRIKKFLSRTATAGIIEFVKRWYNIVQLQLKARDGSLHERVGELNQNMLRLLIDSIVLASMAAQLTPGEEAAMPDDQPEPDVLTAAMEVSMPETMIHAKAKNSAAAPRSASSQQQPPRDTRTEIMSNFHTRAVWYYDQVVDCSRALLHACNELEPNLYGGTQKNSRRRRSPIPSICLLRAALLMTVNFV